MSAFDSTDIKVNRVARAIHRSLRPKDYDPEVHILEWVPWSHLPPFAVAHFERQARFAIRAILKCAN